MNHEHVALIVEDEPVAAAEIAERVASLGHRPIVVSSRVDGLSHLDESCYMIADQKIYSTPDSLNTNPDEGDLLIRQARERRPRRDNRTGQHYYPIIAISGHAKKTRDGVSRMKSGADDFLCKPLDEDGQSLRETIVRILELSGIIDHELCALAKTNARGLAGATPGARTYQIDVIGTHVTGLKRTEVLVDGKKLEILDSSFRPFIRLAEETLKGGEGWVDTSDLTNDARNVTRLRDEFGVVIPRTEIIRNGRNSNYSLHPSMRIVRIAWELLLQHPEEFVRNVASRHVPRILGAASATS